MTKRTFNWCARCQYEGKQEFMLGTVVAEETANMDPIMAAFMQLIDKLFPTRPTIISIQCGFMGFVPQKGPNSREQHEEEAL